MPAPSNSTSLSQLLQMQPDLNFQVSLVDSTDEKGRPTFNVHTTASVTDHSSLQDRPPTGDTNEPETYLAGVANTIDHDLTTLLGDHLHETYNMSPDAPFEGCCQTHRSHVLKDFTEIVNRYNKKNRPSRTGILSYVPKSIFGWKPKSILGWKPHANRTNRISFKSKSHDSDSTPDHSSAPSLPRLSHRIPLCTYEKPGRTKTGQLNCYARSLLEDSQSANPIAVAIQNGTIRLVLKGGKPKILTGGNVNNGDFDWEDHGDTQDFEAHRNGVLNSVGRSYKNGFYRRVGKIDGWGRNRPEDNMTARTQMKDMIMGNTNPYGKLRVEIEQKIGGHMQRLPAPDVASSVVTRMDM